MRSVSVLNWFMNVHTFLTDDGEDEVVGSEGARKSKSVLLHWARSVGIECKRTLFTKYLCKFPSAENIKTRIMPEVANFSQQSLDKFVPKLINNLCKSQTEIGGLIFSTSFNWVGRFLSTLWGSTTHRAPRPSYPAGELSGRV